ncbi:hypothetical protein FPHOBKDP_00116 [Listeria phage LPJP1]|nr:hypothetical protein FPHOBKDP_00116 [Listeria phage LPJP1]
MERTKIVNIYLSCMLDGSSTSSNIMNMCLGVEEAEGVISNYYYEFTNYDIATAISQEDSMKVYNNQLANNVEKIYTYDANKNIRIMKDEDATIYNNIESLLLELSNSGKNKILFWVDNPIDWIHFLDKAFLFKNKIPVIPEYIIPEPINIFSVYQFLDYTSGDSISKIGEMFNVPEEALYSSIIRSQFVSKLSRLTALSLNQDTNE